MQIDTLIIGAGAAGMMCASQCGGRTVVIDHARAPGEKIRISGGGRCNFTNMHCGFDNFLSQNAHFHKSALSRYTQWDFIDLMARHSIAWHEKTLGQLFCDGSAKQVVAMLLDEMKRAGAELWLHTTLEDLSRDATGFVATVTRDGKRLSLRAANVVMASGGKSIPKMGATGLSYDIAHQFGHAVTELRPALVPFTFPEGRFAELAGLAVPVRITATGTSFDEAMLFTHRGLSGPAVLQISSYWREGESIGIDLSPENDLFDLLRQARSDHGRRAVTTALAHHLPARLVQHLASAKGWDGPLGGFSDPQLLEIAQTLQNWIQIPSGTEGYRTAEVTLGGIDTDGLSSQTMMSKHVPGLYFIGECVDVTGWLGGYNFQWAWSSGVVAGRAIAGNTATGQT